MAGDEATTQETAEAVFAQAVERLPAHAKVLAMMLAENFAVALTAMVPLIEDTANIPKLEEAYRDCFLGVLRAIRVAGMRQMTEQDFDDHHAEQRYLNDMSDAEWDDVEREDERDKDEDFIAAGLGYAIRVGQSITVTVSGIRLDGSIRPPAEAFRVATEKLLRLDIYTAPMTKLP